MVRVISGGDPISQPLRSHPVIVTVTVLSGGRHSARSIVSSSSSYTTPSRLRDRMHDFKEHTDPVVRASEGRAVAAIAARYMLEHGTAMARRFGGWDATVAVPSTLCVPETVSLVVRRHFGIR